MKKAIVVLIMALCSCSLFPQAISNLKIEKRRFYPLAEDDIGLQFSYFVNRGGNIESYIQLNSDPFPIGQKGYEPWGKTYFTVPKFITNEILKDDINTGGFSVEVIHYSRFIRRTKLSLPVKYNINAPYGRTYLSLPSEPVFFDFPQKPEKLVLPPSPMLFNEDVKKKVVNPPAVVLLIAGAATIVMAETIAESINNHNSGKISPEPIYAAGLVISLASISIWKKTVSDKIAGDRNKTKNAELINNWNNEIARIQSLNKELIDSWNAEGKEIIKTNKEIKEKYDNDIKITIERNERIKGTFHIEISTSHD